MNRPSASRAAVLSAAALAGVLALSGCSTNFDAPTDQVYTPARGANDRDAAVDVLNAMVVAPVEGKGTVIATLVNNETAADQLVSITVEGATAEAKNDDAVTEIKGLGALNLATEGAFRLVNPVVALGDFVEITFVFENSEPVIIEAPVVPATGDYADVPVVKVPASELPQEPVEEETEEEDSHGGGH